MMEKSNCNRGGDESDDDKPNGMDDEGDGAGDIDRDANDNNEGWCYSSVHLTSFQWTQSFFSLFLILLD